MPSKVEFVPIDKILKRGIPLEYSSEGRLIGASIITPKQILHAIPADANTKYHYYILKETCKSIYPNMTSEIQEFQLLTVHYVIETSDEKTFNTAFIYSPAYITPNQAEMLKDLLGCLKNSDFKLGLIIGEYNPFKNREDKSIKRFFIDPFQMDKVEEPEEYILNIYRCHGRIVEYTLPFGEEVIIPLEEQYKM